MHSICSSCGWYFPGMQSKQAVIPGFGWRLPSVQTSQSVFRATVDDALPAAHIVQLSCFFSDWYLPGIQFKHVATPCSGWWLPLSHSKQRVKSSSLEDLFQPFGHNWHPLPTPNWPAPHTWHTVLLFPRVYWPIGHISHAPCLAVLVYVFSWQSMHSVCFFCGWYLPGMQFKQSVIPGFGWWLPLVQTSQSVSRAGVDDALPISHSVQSLCFVSVWYLPGMQLKQAVEPSSGWWLPLSHCWQRLKIVSLEDRFQPFGHNTQPLPTPNLPTPHTWHTVLPSPRVNWPIEHTLHSLCVDVLVYVFSRQSMHLICSSCGWYLPGMQFKQSVIPSFGW